MQRLHRSSCASEERVTIQVAVKKNTKGPPKQTPTPTKTKQATLKEKPQPGVVARKRSQFLNPGGHLTLSFTLGVVEIPVLKPVVFPIVANQVPPSLLPAVVPAI